MIPEDLKKPLNQKKWEKYKLHEKYTFKDFFIPLYLGIAAVLLILALWMKGCVDEYRNGLL